MKSVLASFLAALVAAFLLAGCVTAPTKPHPTMVLRQGGNTLTLMTTPCNPKVADLLKPEFVPQFKNAVALVDGQTFDACWIMADPATIYVQFEDGDNATIPVSAFIQAAAKPRKPQQKPDDWKNSA